MNSTTTASSEYEYLERWRSGSLVTRPVAARARCTRASGLPVAVTAAMVWLGLRALSWSL
jgi:hypothetical protein